MLFVPDEDYVRLPDNVNITTITTGSTTNTAAAAADDDDDNAVSISILFASQAQYLGHSDQVSLSASTTGRSVAFHSFLHFAASTWNSILYHNAAYCSR